MQNAVRALVALAAVLLLAPFLLLAVAPMLLMLGPVAFIGIPMIVPALLYSSLGTRARERKRSSHRPDVRRATTGRLITR
jgi:hypothetical protein